MNLDQIKADILKKEADFINIRKFLHKNPELGMKEYKTTDFIIETLKSFGINNIEKIKDTGVVAVIGEDFDNCVAIRADIDALPINEDNDLDFKSVNENIMHACGHDLHTTCLLGAAYIFQNYKDDLKGSVKLIFQPGEEVAQGAKYMIENGVLENEPRPKCIFGLHAWPLENAGTVFHRHGKMGASSDRFTIKIYGKSGHAAHPNKAVDPILIAGHVIVALQAIISREISALDQAVITVASIHSGQATNVIPAEVELKGAIRCLDEDVRSFVHQRLEEIAKSTAKSFRGQAEVSISKGIPVSYNEERLSEEIERSLIKALGQDAYIYNPHPSMGSEDFAYYGQHIPAAMYRLGTGFANKVNPPLHSKDLMINEAAIKTGILSMVAVAFDLLENFDN